MEWFFSCGQDHWLAARFLPRLSLYFERRFERGIKEGKTFANRGRISGIGSVKQHSY